MSNNNENETPSIGEVLHERWYDEALKRYKVKLRTKMTVETIRTIPAESAEDALELARILLIQDVPAEGVVIEDETATVDRV